MIYSFNDIVVIANEKWRVKQVMHINTMEIKIKEKEIVEDEEDESPPIWEYGNAARRSLVMTKNLRKSVVAVTNEAAKDLKRGGKGVEGDFPEFELFSAAHDSTEYVAKDLESIVQFRDTVRLWRHNMMRSEVNKIKNRSSTLGSFSNHVVDQQQLIHDTSLAK